MTLIDRLAVKGAPTGSRTQAMLRNPDLTPVRPEHRTWGWLNYVFFWVSDGLNINTWMIASSSLTAGLAWWQAWLAVWIGYGFVAFFVVLSARIGSHWHIGFPVVARASFGIWGSFWPVLNRAVMACVWTAVQTWIGGTCMTLILRSIIPGYVHLKDHVLIAKGDEVILNRQSIVSFLLFWAFQLPFVWAPISKIRHLFTIKSVIVPIAAIAFFAWSIKDANGLGPIVKQPATIKGSLLGWTFVQACMSCVSNMATLTVNVPDFARVAKKPKDVVMSQLIAIPCTFALTCFIGIIVSSSSVPIFGKTVWDPLELLAMRLDRDPYDSGTRAGVFFIAAAFALAQLGVNIAANTLSAGSDLTALLPKFINIRRGGMLCILITPLIMPWHLMSSSSTFTTYLGSYSIFLSSILGTILADYYIVRRGYLHIPSLFSAAKSKSNAELGLTLDNAASLYDSPAAAYNYSFGCNWRAYVSYIAGIATSVTGFAGVTGVQVSDAAQKIYILAFFTGLGASSILYAVLSWLFPYQGVVHPRSKVWLEPASGWEAPDWDRPTADLDDGRGDASTGARTAKDLENATSDKDSDIIKDKDALGSQEQEINTIPY
ncbi:uracil permease [Tilletia horrida]|nr:uracil permease [Tilletia horrida]